MFCQQHPAESLDPKVGSPEMFAAFHPNIMQDLWPPQHPVPCHRPKGNNELWYIHLVDYYSAIKKNEFESVVVMWMNLESVIQSEVSQKEKKTKILH